MKRSSIRKGKILKKSEFLNLFLSIIGHHKKAACQQQKEACQLFLMSRNLDGNWFRILRTRIFPKVSHSGRLSLKSTCFSDLILLWPTLCRHKKFLSQGKWIWEKLRSSQSTVHTRARTHLMMIPQEGGIEKQGKRFPGSCQILSYLSVRSPIKSTTRRLCAGSSSLS
jgi:hypothetical protein